MIFLDLEKHANGPAKGHPTNDSLRIEGRTLEAKIKKNMQGELYLLSGDSEEDAFPWELTLQDPEECKQVYELLHSENVRDFLEEDLALQDDNETKNPDFDVKGEFEKLMAALDARDWPSHKPKDDQPIPAEEDLGEDPEDSQKLSDKELAQEPKPADLTRRAEKADAENEQHATVEKQMSVEALVRRWYFSCVVLFS